MSKLDLQDKFSDLSFLDCCMVENLVIVKYCLCSHFFYFTDYQILLFHSLYLSNKHLFYFQCLMLRILLFEVKEIRIFKKLCWIFFLPAMIFCIFFYLLVKQMIDLLVVKLISFWHKYSEMKQLCISIV